MKHIKNYIKAYLIQGVLGVLVLLTVFFGLWDKYENEFYDTLFHIRGEKNPGNEIVIIAMDEKSISKLGPLPWNRSVHAELLTKLKAAKVVGFDILFDTYSDSIHDQKFVEAVTINDNVILASMFSFEKHVDGNWYQTLIKPIPELSDVVKGTGFINMPSDKNVIRNAVLFDKTTFGDFYPSFNVALFMASQGNVLSDVTIQDNKMVLNGKTTRVTNTNQAIIDFWGPGGTFPTFSYIDVLNGNLAAETFHNKIVLIGIVTPTVKSDYYDNPFTGENLVLKGKLPVPGVEIHASAIKTYMEQRSFSKLSVAANIVVLLFVFFLVMVINHKSSYLLSYPITIVLIASIVSLSYLLWYYYFIIMNVIAPIVMIIVLFALNTTQNLVKSEIEKRKTRVMFSRYMSSSVVDQLLSKDSVNINTSTYREATILFADLRNFTSYSEDRSPEEVVSRLNYYFREMTEIIFRHGGTLDKYIGDCIMAVFGAPIPSVDHATQAVLASVEMMKKAVEISNAFQISGEEIMSIGIGINTGNVISGNVGSEIRMDYTVIGDAVNLASRFEGLSKEYNNGIILGKNTVEKLDNLEISNWKINPLGIKKIKGLTREVEVFILEKADDYQ